MACHTTYCVGMKLPALQQAVSIKTKLLYRGPEKGWDQTQVGLDGKGCYKCQDLINHSGSVISQNRVLVYTYVETSKLARYNFCVCECVKKVCDNCLYTCN